MSTPEYSLLFRCKPITDLRLREVTKVLKAVEAELPCDGWMDAKGQILSDERTLMDSLDSCRRPDFDRFPMTWVAESISNEPTMLTVLTGGSESSVNSFKIVFYPNQYLPSLTLFKEIIQTVNACDACFVVHSAEARLRSKYRFQRNQQNPIGLFSCIHYLDRNLTEKLDIDRKLGEYPHWVRTKFLDGEIFQFATSLQCCNDGTTLDRQVLTMQLLGMISEELPFSSS